MPPVNLSRKYTEVLNGFEGTVDGRRRRFLIFEDGKPPRLQSWKTLDGYEIVHDTSDILKC